MVHQAINYTRGIAVVLLIAFASLVDAQSQMTPRPNPVRRSIGKNTPFPGVRRCVVSLELSPYRVISTNLTGDALAHGTFRIAVFQRDRQIHLKVHFDVEWLTAPLPPASQAIYEGRRGINGVLRLPLPATWRNGSHANEIKMDTWITAAAVKTLPGSSMTVYELIKRIDVNPRNFYVQIATQAFPEGAVRGQFARGAINRLIPTPLC